MKIIYLFTVLFLNFSANKSMAQVVLDASDVPQIGDEFINANDTTNIDTILPISTGINQSWDFSWIRNDSQDTTYYVDPASTPEASTFPTATLAQSGQQGYTYFFADQNHLEVIGGQIDTITVIFENPLTYFIFPLSYNSFFTDTGIMNTTIAYDTTIDISGITVTIDSVRIHRTMILTDSVVGWGSITTPITTYDSVLQMKSKEEDIDSIFVHTTGIFSTWMPIQNMSNITNKWEWLTKYKKTALVSFEVSEDTIKKITYFLDPLVNIETQTTANLQITIFPNPANLFFSINAKTPVSFVEIFDMTGNIVQSIITNNQPVSVEKLPSGNYLIKSYGSNQKLLGINKLIITK